MRQISTLIMIFLFSSLLYGDISLKLTPKEKEWISKHPVIKVGGEMDWPPFDYVENGEYRGIASDYLKLVEKNTNLKFEMVTGYTWNQLLEMIQKKEIDLLPMIYYSEKRAKYVHFTKSYLDVRHYLYSRSDETFESFKELKGKKVAVPTGFAQAEILRKKYPDIEIYEAGNSLDCIDAVITQKADAFVENTALVTYYVKKHKIKGIKASFSTELGVNKLHMASRYDAKILRDIIQKSLLDIDKTEQEKIANKWLKIDQKVDYGLVVEIVFVAFLIILALIIFTYMLRRKIKSEVQKSLKLQSYVDQIDSIIDASWSMMIVNDGSKIARVNKKFKNFFDIENIQEFKSQYSCLCETFENIEDSDYINNNKSSDDSFWLQNIVETKYQQSKVAIKKNDKLYHYIIHVSVIELSLKEYYLIELIDITAEIEQSNEIEAKNTIIAEQAKMSALGEMIGNIAHQWRQPLSAISSSASSLELFAQMGTLNSKDVREYTQEIVSKSEYLSNTIETFRNFIKNQKQKKEMLLYDIIDTVFQIVGSTLHHNSIEIRKKLPNEDIKFTVVSGELEQVLINILNNAKDVLTDNQIENPYIDLEAQMENNKLIITIEDNGGGIPDSVMPKLFIPYFTTKHESIGTGLGLHMSYKIITESFHGKLHAKNTKEGAQFIIEIPLNI